MAIQSTYDVGFIPALGNKEDLLDMVTMIDPWDTPFFSTAPKSTANHTLHEWLVDSLTATATAGAIEGADFSGPALTARARLHNFTQIFRKDINVTDTQRAVNPAGIRDEYEYQVMKGMREIARNIEAAVFKIAGATVSGDEATARAMGGIRNWEATLPKVNVAGAITTAFLVSLHESVYSAGGNPDTLYLSPGVKVDFTSAINTNATINTRNIAASDKKLIANIDVFESDFGLLAVVADRFVPQVALSSASAAFFLIERSKVRLAMLRPMRHVPIGKGGDATRGMIVTELTLEMLHPSANGMGTGVTT